VKDRRKVHRPFTSA